MTDIKKKSSTYTEDGNIGRVQISDQVVSVIAGIAATEVEGVAALVGNVTNEIVSRMGIKNLSKGIKIEMIEDTVMVKVTLELKYGYNIPEVCVKVQERVVSSIETMTGISVAKVDVCVSDIIVDK